MRVLWNSETVLYLRCLYVRRDSDYKSSRNSVSKQYHFFRITYSQHKSNHIKLQFALLCFTTLRSTQCSPLYHSTAAHHTTTQHNIQLKLNFFVPVGTD